MVCCKTSQFIATNVIRLVVCKEVMVRCVHTTTFLGIDVENI